MSLEQSESKRKSRTVCNEVYCGYKGKRDQEEYRDGVCPFFMRDRGKGVIYCECARFHFPDKLARRECVYALCAHPTDYKKCPINRTMEHFYERKFNSLNLSEENEGSGGKGDNV